MSVYVDDAAIPYRNRFGRTLIMHHMIADSTEELLAMADRVGVPRKWIQKEGTPSEHFDVCLTKREAAIHAGAIPVTAKELSQMIMARKVAK